MMKLKEIRKIIISELDNGHDVAEIWNLDAINYLKTNKNFDKDNRKRSRSPTRSLIISRPTSSSIRPPRSPLCYEKTSNFIITNKFKYFNIYNKKIYLKILYLYLMIIVLFILYNLRFNNLSLY